MDPRRDEAVLIAPNGGGPNPPCRPRPGIPPPPGPGHAERGASAVHLAWPLGRPVRPASVLVRVHHLPAMRLPPARIMGSPRISECPSGKRACVFGPGRIFTTEITENHGGARRSTEKAGQSPEGQSRLRARTGVVKGRRFGRGWPQMHADKRERAHGPCHRSGTSAYTRDIRGQNTFPSTAPDAPRFFRQKNERTHLVMMLSGSVSSSRSS